MIINWLQSSHKAQCRSGQRARSLKHENRKLSHKYDDLAANCINLVLPSLIEAVDTGALSMLAQAVIGSSVQAIHCQRGTVKIDTKHVIAITK